MNDDEQDRTAPSEQRGGSTPDDARRRARGPWQATAQDGLVPAELGGSDAPPEDARRRSRSSAAGCSGATTGSDEPATETGVDLTAGDSADAVTDGGPDPTEAAEPDLKDVAAAAREAGKDSAA